MKRSGRFCANSTETHPSLASLGASRCDSEGHSHRRRADRCHFVMRRSQLKSGRQRRAKRTSADASRQLALPIEVSPNYWVAPSRHDAVVVAGDRCSGNAVQTDDALLRTAEVVRIVNHHRCTLYRWMRAGAFPQRHRGKGWKRSEIERWLAGDTSRKAN
jgi:predicted DNA-binding transcriptional regulator AlpA